MQKDFTESTNDNSILNLLEKHDAFSLIDEKASCLYPRIWGLCEFERKGIGYVGKYESPEKPMNIEYEIYKTPQYEDVLTCKAKAPLKYWTYWRDQFPEDFVQAMVLNSPSGIIFPSTEITVQRTVTFKKDTLCLERYMWAEIYAGYKLIKIFKRDSNPVIITTDVLLNKTTYPLYF